MSNGKMLSRDFGGLTPSENLRELDKLKKIIELEPDITDDLELIFKKKGRVLPDIFKPPPVFEIPPKTVFPFDPFKPPPPQPQPPAPTTPEIDTKLQLLLNAIPIAHPGNIITSEYHNALRDAVRALASRIGLNVNPAAEYRILTFAPNFLPVVPPSPNVVMLAWDIKLNRAGIPATQTGANSPVSGGMIVQLPDGATIFQMIVRGKRLGTAAPNPKTFAVALKRLKFGKEETQQILTGMDLSAVKDGVFEEKGSVKLSDEEASSSNDVIGGITVADRKIVNNEKWNYLVTADWQGSTEASAKFEINSVQIVCKV